MIGIYVYTNKENGKQYVGKSTDIYGRKQGHLRKVQCGDTSPFHNALRKYGEDGFLFEILEECESDMLNERERFYIKKLNSAYPNGYNLTEGGDGGDMFAKRSEAQIAETRRKMSLSHVGKKHTKEEIEKISASQKGKPRMYAKNKTPWNKGMKMSEDFCQKISDSGRGEKNGMFGKKQSQLCRQKNSEIHKGQTPANKGKHLVWDNKEEKRFHYE